MAARDARGHGRNDKDPQLGALAKHIQKAGLPPDPKPIAKVAGRVRRTLLRKRSGK